MSVDIQLKFPIDDGGVAVNVVKLRRPKVRDMVSMGKAEGANAEKELKLFVSLTGLTPDLIEEMDLLDYKKLQDEYERFLD